MNTNNCKLWGLWMVVLLSLTSTEEVHAAVSQNTAAGTWIGQHMILVIGFIVFVFAVIVIAQLARGLMIFQSEEILAQKGLVKKTVTSTSSSTSIWSNWMKKAWNLAPMTEEQSITLGHDFDGIRELDNKLPPWWLGLMYGSILFAVVYMYYYHFSGREWSSTAEYQAAMEVGDEIKAAYLFKMANAVNETNVAMLEDAEDLNAGAAVYKMNCAACHGQQGQGLVGPNLTDDYWVHGGDIKDIFRTIKYGVPEKGMIAWSTQLRPQTMQQVASYIMTLRGTNPPNPKSQEGKLYVPTPE